MTLNKYAQRIGLVTLSVLTLSFVSCTKEGCIDETALNYDAEAKKDDGTCTYQEYADLKLSFDHVFGMAQEDFMLNKDYVHPKTGDTLNFSLLKYYVSNIKLKSADGTWWEEADSYHLVCEGCDLGNAITLADVPAGSYTEVMYTLGVDSAMNVDGAQSGALSPSNEMFWSWNSGYIMMKAEGTSPNSATGAFSFHLGGFSGEYNVVTTKSSDFGGSTLEVSAGNVQELSFKSNVAQLWHMASSVSDVNVIHMPGEMAYHMASHYFEGFQFVMIN